MKQNIKATVLFVTALLASSMLANANGNQPLAPLEELESQQRAGEGLFHIRPAGNDSWKSQRELRQKHLKERNKISREQRKEDGDRFRKRNQEDADWRRKNNLLNPNREPLWKRNRDIQQERLREDMEIKNKRFFERQKLLRQQSKEESKQRMKNLLKLPELNRGRSQGFNRNRNCPEKKDDGRFRLKPRC